MLQPSRQFFLLASSALLIACDPPSDQSLRSATLPVPEKIQSEINLTETCRLIGAQKNLSIRGAFDPNKINAIYEVILDQALLEIRGEVLTLPLEDKIKITHHALLQKGFHLQFSAAPDGGVAFVLYSVEKKDHPVEALPAKKMHGGSRFEYYEITKQLAANTDRAAWIAATIPFPQSSTIPAAIVYNAPHASLWSDVSKEQIFYNECGHVRLYAGMHAGHMPTLHRGIQEAYSDYCSISAMRSGAELDSFIKKLSHSARISPQTYGFSNQICVKTFLEMTARTLPAAKNMEKMAQLLALDPKLQDNFRLLLISNYYRNLLRGGIPEAYLKLSL